MTTIANSRWEAKPPAPQRRIESIRISRGADQAVRSRWSLAPFSSSTLAREWISRVENFPASLTPGFVNAGHCKSGGKLYASFRLAELPRAFGGCLHGVDQCTADSVLLQHLQAGDCGAARAGDGILERSGMLSG